MLQIAYGLRKAGLQRPRVVHPVELLDQAYRVQEQQTLNGVLDSQKTN
jgi:hypothetical protein